MCQKNLLYYLKNYVWIQDRVRQTIVKWLDWSHLVQLVDIVQEWHDQPEPRKPIYVIVFKSRQVGASTTICAIANWLVTFFESSKVMELSQKEDDASELVDRSRFIHNHYPDWMRFKLDPDQSGLIGFPPTNGRIRALPSTEHAGRSTDATMVFADEWEFHPYAENNFAALKPTMDKGGLFIGASTVDKINMTSFPKIIWRQSKARDNNFRTLFWDYFSVPDRTEETYKSSISGLPDWQKEAEYPRSEEEALSAPKSTCFFDREVIAEMLKECANPVEERYGGKIRIYKKAVSDRKYCFVIDSSEGQDDPCAGVISDWQTDEDVVALHGKMSLDEQAKLVFELYQEYNQCFIAVERNAGGLTLIEKLLNLGVDTWYYCDTAKKKPGWWTQHTNRPVMLNELAEAITLRLKRIPMRDALNEFLQFSWIDGKPQAIRGAHDDWVIAHAIMGQMRKQYKPKGMARATSFKYQES